MKPLRLEVSESTTRSLAEVARRHGIRLLVAFGSRAGGRPRPDSDLDLAVLLDADAPGDELGLLAELQRLFPSHEVDVVWLQRADPLLAWEVFRHPRLLYGDRGDLVQYATYAWRRFVEYGRYFAEEARAVRREIARLRDAHR